MIDAKLQEVAFYSKKRRSACIRASGNLTSVLSNKEQQGLWHSGEEMPWLRGTAAIQVRQMLPGGKCEYRVAKAKKTYLWIIFDLLNTSLRLLVFLFKTKKEM